MENTENTENKVANSFLADRLAGLVDAVGNPIAQAPTNETAQKEVASNTISEEESQDAEEIGIGEAIPPIENEQEEKIEATEKPKKKTK